MWTYYIHESIFQAERVVQIFYDGKIRGKISVYNDEEEDALILTLKAGGITEHKQNGD